jgi:hypothetical protein
MTSLRFLLPFALPAAALLVAVMLAGPTAAVGAPVDEVQESFRSYKTAILQSDGKAAAQVVTQESRDYFRGLADQALTSNSDALHRIHLSDRIYALLLRHDVAPAALQRMSGAEVVSHAVEQGWIGREGADGLALGSYEVMGNIASGTILRPDGSETAFKMGFVMQDGRWRLDLVALMDLTRAAFEFALQQSGLEEDAFVLAMLEQVTGRKPGPEIWTPPS